MSLPTSTASILSPTLALPPSDPEPVLGSKRSRNASKLGDGITAHLVSSAEELEKAKEARKQKAAQRALKRGGNVPDTGRVTKTVCWERPHCPILYLISGSFWRKKRLNSSPPWAKPTEWKPLTMLNRGYRCRFIYSNANGLPNIGVGVVRE